MCLVIHIHTSHRTEMLLDAFVENLVRERKDKGSLVPVQVVVPNRNVETYLRLRVAERCGIAANIEMSFLRNRLAAIAEEALPDARAADVTHVEGHLLALFHHAAVLARPELTPVRAYLAAAGSERDALDRRRCQLAALLAQLFDEYAASRPEMLAAWLHDEPTAARGPELELAVWQRALWLAVFGPGGRLAEEAKRTKRRILPLEALFGEAMRRTPAPWAGETLHVFGVSYLATAYHRVLAALAGQADVRIYTLCPCREDPNVLARKPDLQSHDPFGLLNDENQALRLWARPGRENLRLLAALPGATVDARFSHHANEAPTLLGRLQNDIVNHLSTAAATAPCETDDSLRVLPCPSVRRELEVVAAEIWGLVRKDPSLRLNDIAVVVPEASKDLYLAHVSAVFGESCDLPHSVADLPAAAGHRVAEAIQLLLDLPFSSFSRRDFLPLLTHPLLMARFPTAAPERWRALTSALGIVRGADRGDFAGSYVTRDLFNWAQGLRRLALGALVGDEEGAAPVLLNGEPCLPGPALEDGDDDATLGFGLLARSLIADARFAAGPNALRPLREWLAFVRAMVESYVVLDDDDDAGKGVVAHFFAALEELADSGLHEQQVSYRVASELTGRALAALPWSRGHYLSSGVTVASFVPMRAIPFRAVFVLGLGQAAFPRPAGRHELDLRGTERRAGDVDRREQDLYMFLETLLSARDQVVLSYVARDEITGDELPASSVLFELRAILSQGALGEAGLARLFCDDRKARPPLRRYDDSPERRQVLPVSEGEHRARELGRMLATHARRTESVRERVAHLPSSLARPLSRILNLPSHAANAAREPLQALVVPLSALYRFLVDPLQGSARFRLGLYEEDDGALDDVEDEPLDVDRRFLSLLVRASMSQAILAAQGVPAWEDVLAAYARRSLRGELAGQSPTGLFRKVAERVEENLLSAWHSHLPGILGPSLGPSLGPARTDCRIVQFVQAHRDEESRVAGIAFRAAPRFRVDLPDGAGDTRRAVDISVEGQTELCARSAPAGDASLIFSHRGKIGNEARSREQVRAFLDYVALTASGTAAVRPGHRCALFFAAGELGKLRVLRFHSLDRDRALDYLARLCTDFLTGARDGGGAHTGVHPYLLPHEAVFSSRANGTSIFDEVDDLRVERESRGTSFSSLQGPVPDVLARYAPLAESDAQRAVKERFGLFFDLAEGDSI
jgi:exodeoxyribonuclease V gamma subunit